MTRRTRGHELFEEWLRAEHGESARSQGRPSFEALQDAADEMRKEMRAVSSAKVPPQAGGLYHYLSSSGDNVRRVPRRGLRLLIELVTRGTVPRSAWDEPVGAEDAITDEGDAPALVKGVA